MFDNSTLKITCTEKYVLPDKSFVFNFPHVYTEHVKLSQDQFYSEVVNQDIIIISDLIIDEKILANNPNLKLVALCSTGYDHVDISLLKRRGIKICNIIGQATDAVAEHAFTFMINLFKNFKQQIDAVHQNLWSLSETSFCLAAPMRELHGKTLTIIGKGNIGRSLAEKANAFGMKVLFSERKNAKECRAGYTPFEEAIQCADVISLHCLLNEETKNLIDINVFKKMKKESFLINLGRGELINDKDLIFALNHALIAGFATDVLNQEPPPLNHPLLKIKKPNVLITGHIAWATEEAQQRLFRILEENINKNVSGYPKNLL